MRALSSRLLVLGFIGLLASLLTACDTVEAPFTIKLILLEGETLSSCQTVDLKKVTNELNKGTHTLRYTFIRQGATVGSRTLHSFDLDCYRVVPVNASEEFLVPTGDSPLSLFVEAFDAKTGELAFSGLAPKLDLESSEVTVYLHPKKFLSCGKHDNRPRRAFHSATLLPNGKVLMLGGIISNGGQLLEELNATDQALLFDPMGLSWNILLPADPLLARAFHQAVLLPSPPEGPYEVLVMGGMVAAQGGFVLRRSPVDISGQRDFPCEGAPAERCSYHFAYLPHEQATPGGTAIVTYTPSDGSLKVSAINGLTPSVFPQLALNSSGSHALVVGGAMSYDATDSATQGFQAGNRIVEWVALQGSTERQGALEVQQLGVGGLRAGHAVAPLGGKYLILGITRQAEWGDTSGFAQALASTLTPLGWQTLTPLGLSDLDLAKGATPQELLWAGGFPLDAVAGSDYSWAVAEETNTRPNAFSRLRLLSNTLSELPSTLSTRFERAGYHAALRLGDGGVLLSGGNFQSDTCPLPAPGDPLLTTYCPSDALTVLDSGDSDVIARDLPPSLHTRRYGHRATRLLDNRVLFSGGISIGAGGTPTLVETWEILNPLTHTINRLPLVIRGSKGDLFEDGTMTSNGDEACVSRSGASQESSAMKTLTSPLPRERMRRRTRSMRVFSPPTSE
ncbi:MAG: hypothetical protein JRH20_05520 [Deltaproteobacteria bacterium]|nr:hypothetical protein [Deltaproteobacteria bacterium]